MSRALADELYLLTRQTKDLHYLYKSMATAYWALAGITFAIVVFAFLSDRAADKRDLRAFAFITAATLLWPITLPCILHKQYLTAKTRQQASKKAKILSQLQRQSASATASKWQRL